MNAREKTLLILMAVVGVLFGGRAVYNKYNESLDDYKAKIRNLNKDITKIELENEQVMRARNDWFDIGAQTLSMDANEAMTRLRDEMTRLTERPGLSEVTVSLESTPKKWPKSDLQVLNFTVNAEGDLDAIVDFLFDLHHQPYAVRCKSLVLEQVNKPSRTRDKKQLKMGLLQMKTHLDMLILPANALVAEFPPAELDPKKRKPVQRTQLATLDGYKPLLDKKLFQPYEPPPKPRPEPPTGTVTDRRPEKRPPPRPSTPRDAKMVLGRTLSSPRGQLAVLEDPRKKNSEGEYKEVGDEMYGGTLVYVHPRGAVTEKDGQRRFHAIGEALQAGKPLSEDNEPAIYHELLKLERAAAGISKGPGGQ